MSKSILVKNCAQCKYSRNKGEDHFSCTELDDIFVKEYDETNTNFDAPTYYTKRHPQCPLQDTTELEKIFKDILFSLQCIDTNGTARDSAVKEINKLYKVLSGTKI